MLNKDWPNIFETDISGIKYWVVDGRRYHAGAREGKREYFHSKKLAEGRAEVLRQDVMKVGFIEGSIPNALRVDAMRAQEKLLPYGATLLEAVNFYISHRDAQNRLSNLKLAEAVEKFMEMKKELNQADKYSNNSLKTARKRLKHLTEAFPQENLTSITVADFEDWLNKTKFSSRSMAGIKSVASEFFKWCVKRGWITSNPAQFMRITHVTKEAEILTVEQAKKLVEAAYASSFRERATPYALLGLFAGLRPSEAEDLRRGDIHFETQEIKVISRKLRGEIRYVHMRDSLSKRMNKFKWDGSLAGQNWQKQIQAVKTMAGFGEKTPFPTDCLRHSFASYWLAMSLAGAAGFEGGSARLAEIMGNSVDVIKEHYRKAIPRTTAEQFWAILDGLKSN
ncbi:MAG: phage integrase SAM-like domain-containing protein [Verrucomicrobiae bacterium]|nr:phage integrase SAM-like domain-containing protein [Verrucomicrobiae bacterium]